MNESTDRILDEALAKLLQDDHNDEEEVDMTFIAQNWKIEALDIESWALQFLEDNLWCYDEELQKEIWANCVKEEDNIFLTDNLISKDNEFPLRDMDTQLLADKAIKLMVALRFEDNRILEAFDVGKL